MAYIPSSGSVVAFQSDPTKLQVTASVAGAVTANLASSNASVITVGQSSVAVAIVSGSIAATVTPPANQSVSGTVGANLNSTNASVITTVQGSVAVAIVSGSVAVSTGNSSVMLLNSANVIGSVAALQGTNPWIITGSVQATAAANQSVSGTVGANLISSNASVIATIQGSVATVIIGGSVATATTNSSVMLLNGANAIGSVTALQGTNPWVVVGSVYGAGSVAAFQAGTRITSLVSITPSSVQVGASIMGIAPVTITANTIPASALAFLAATSSVTANIASTITVTGYPTTELQITSSPSMTATVTFQGSADGSSWRPIIGYNQETGALASITTVADANWSFNTAGLQAFRALIPAWTAGSITGKVYLSPVDARPFATYVTNTTPSSMLTGASILGQLPAGTAPLGSVATLQGTNPWVIVGSVYGNVSGSVAAFQNGTWSTSVMTNVITSIATAGQVMGSVATLQGTNPWIVNFQNSSVLAVPVGSTIAYLQAPSIVGTYAEDAAHTDADKGILHLGVRNDAVSSMTSAERDYGAFAVDSAGRVITTPFAGPQACLISYVGSIVSGSVQLIQASVIGSRSYITDFWVSNTGAATTLVTIQGGDTSILGQFIAPTGGGMSSPGIAIPLRTTTSQDLAFKVSPSTSILYLTLKGYQAP